MKIAVVGSYGVGMTMKVLHAPAAGETMSGGVLSVGHGGKGSNQAVAMARLGADVKLFSAIGDDPAGRAALEFWHEENIDASHVVLSKHPTMTGFIIVDADGENRIAIAPGALEDLEVGMLEEFKGAICNADLLVVSLEIPLDVAAAALMWARKTGTPTLLNPAPAVQISADVMGCVDVLTPNAGEAEILLGVDIGSQTPAELAKGLASRFDGSVVLTAGAEGVFAQVGTTPFHRRALQVETVVDTTGAGDAFTAALAVAICEGQALEQAVMFATAAGAYAVTIPQVIPSLPRRRDLETLLKLS